MHFVEITVHSQHMSLGLVVKALDSQSRGPVFKTTGWLEGRLKLSSEVDKMSTMDFWELSGKK